MSFEVTKERTIGPRPIESFGRNYLTANVTRCPPWTGLVVWIKVGMLVSTGKVATKIMDQVKVIPAVTAGFQFSGKSPKLRGLWMWFQVGFLLINH